jgi:hypothetical protein
LRLKPRRNDPRAHLADELHGLVQERPQLLRERDTFRVHVIGQATDRGGPEVPAQETLDLLVRSKGGDELGEPRFQRRGHGPRTYPFIDDPLPSRPKLARRVARTPQRRDRGAHESR